MDDNLDHKRNRRKYGQHFTSKQIFHDYIFPKIKMLLDHYIWMDAFCGSGNLLLPILEAIPIENRINFFREHIFLYDVQEKWVEQARKNAGEYGIPYDIAKINIIHQDTLKNPPNLALTKQLPIFHLTNPPYLYIGYIAKNAHTQKYMELFKEKNLGFQDLYQIALMNDLRTNVTRLIYLMPTNFLFGNSVSNQIRKDFLPHYTIDEAIIFEKKIFEFTGTNVLIGFFSKYLGENNDEILFKAKKIGLTTRIRSYRLLKSNHYKAGTEFREFIHQYSKPDSIKIKYYLMLSEILANPGNHKLTLLDSNNYQGNEYGKVEFSVSEKLAEKIKANSLWIRTVDTGKMNGRAGLYSIPSSFKVDGVLVSKNTYRTNPIQVFFQHPIDLMAQNLIKRYFNFILEYLRKITDSEFMTTYKYSGAEYTRKYLGLSQAKKILDTLPLSAVSVTQQLEFKRILDTNDSEEVIKWINS
jgi:type I restriction-modification system DNA methylase subunit